MFGIQAFSCDKYARHRLLGEAELRLADVDLHSEELVRIWLNLHEIDEVCEASLRWRMNVIEPFMGTLKPQSNEPLCSYTVVGTLAVDGWAVTFRTARRGLGGLRPPRCTKCNSPPINGQCTNNFILFDVAL